MHERKRFVDGLLACAGTIALGFIAYAILFATSGCGFIYVVTQALIGTIVVAGYLLPISLIVLGTAAVIGFNYPLQTRRVLIFLFTIASLALAACFLCSHLVPPAHLDCSPAAL